MTFLGNFRWTGAFCAPSFDGVNRQSLLINAIFLEDITGGGTSHGNLLKAPYGSDRNITRSDAVKMLSLNKLRLVFLMCSFFTFYDHVNTAECGKGTTTSCDPSFCCEGKLYDPRKDTCCKPPGNRAGNLTEGLSERMSQCCGEEAYNPLNEICCNLTVNAKPSHDAKCCGKAPYDEKKEVCCSDKLLKKRSPEHLCCYGKLFDSSIENCCQNMFPRIQMKINNSLVCVKNFTCDPTISGEVHKIETNKSDQKNATSTQKQVCEFGDEKEEYYEKEGFQCCGHHYFNTTLWSCEKHKLHVKIQN
ncbi:uncharacterized protein LOC116707921 isoform X1 [Xiphophorus hellerii]|uniref:uncharacterized protein LOC116707921 isoform X1 n=2 Tax=Xiphophorus hellerii TaxID=8084 RepID=UPI0013B4243C|nr:uncharacterized protein LOC116707921 isoform X1 [Xiphophorus hellerii]